VVDDAVADANLAAADIGVSSAFEEWAEARGSLIQLLLNVAIPFTDSGSRGTAIWAAPTSAGTVVPDR